MLLRTALSRGGRGDKLAAVLVKHIEEERKKLGTSAKTSVKTFSTQKGQYTVHVTAPTGELSATAAKMFTDVWNNTRVRQWFTWLLKLLFQEGKSEMEMVKSLLLKVPVCSVTSDGVFFFFTFQFSVVVVLLLVNLHPHYKGAGSRLDMFSVFNPHTTTRGSLFGIITSVQLICWCWERLYSQVISVRRAVLESCWWPNEAGMSVFTRIRWMLIVSPQSSPDRYY